MEAQINFTPVPGVIYVITYKKANSSTWILPPGGDNVTSSPFLIEGIEGGVWYDFKIDSECGTVTLQGQGENVVLIWVEDTYTCNQEEVFTEVSRVETLSSPKYSYYYKPTIGFDRLYVMDQDDVNGVFWWVDPNGFTSPSERTYITGSDALTESYAAVADREYKRLYATGLFTPGPGGLLVYDIENDNILTIPYGSNGSGTFSRTSITVEGNLIYCGDRTNNTITLINRDLLTVNSVVNLSTVPADGSGRKISAGCSLHFINGEIWVWNIGDPGSNNVLLRYNTSLTSLIGAIDTSSYRATWHTGESGSEGYWGKSYFDSSKNRLYLSDIGAATIIVINTTDNSITDTMTIPNRQGFECAATSFITDPITQELYATVQPINQAGTDSIFKTYRINRNDLYFEHIYPELTFQQLERVGTSNILWGTVPNNTKWVGGSWNTDGIAIKFSR